MTCRRILRQLETNGREALSEQGRTGDDIDVIRLLRIRYSGTDTTIDIPAGSRERIKTAFEEHHREYYGFVMPDTDLVIESAAVEVIGAEGRSLPGIARPVELGDVIVGPTVVSEDTSSTVVEPGWSAQINEVGDLVLSRTDEIGTASPLDDLETPDPVMLEVFHGHFMSIAEQMGETLRNTAHSVNIKERLDFSCAVFDGDGRLVANAPHIPVHLGSMSEAVRALINDRGHLPRGEVWLVNSPFNGGTHLPDITVVSPVYTVTSDAHGTPSFYVASRGHHSDVGGISPGSMPSNSETIEDEGVLSDGLLMIADSVLQENDIRGWLRSGKHPCRNPDQNLADLLAQAAANERGSLELLRMVDHFGLATVRAYMGHVRANAADAVRAVIGRLSDGSSCMRMDDGSAIEVSISVDSGSRNAVIDLTGTTPQRDDNFNAPIAVTRAAVLYAFRALVADDIPLNEGCLEPLDIVVPQGCMLNPEYPAAVAAGNVETSQHIVDALLQAMGAQAGSQGTMNNLTFGTADWQYYETIAGGSGAGPDFDGADAVHTHMTNTRMTDVEIIEQRYPVRIDGFAVRHGSGGDGRYRGGEGTIRLIRFLEPATASILSSHRVQAPEGMEGGSDGAKGRNAVIRASGDTEELTGCARVLLERDDTLMITTPGGGGYGDPDRDE